MDDELTPEQKFAAEEPGTMIPRMLGQGRSKEEIVHELVRLDWSQSAADALVTRYVDDLQRYHESPQSREQLLKELGMQIAIGGVIALFGIGITAFTVLAAIAGATGYFVIAFGLILGGIVIMFHGWNRMYLYQDNDRTQTPSEPTNEESLLTAINSEEVLTLLR